MSLYATPKHFLNQYQDDETVEISNQDNPDEWRANGVFIQAVLNTAEGEVLTYLGNYTHPFFDTVANIPIAPPAYLIYAICAIARKQMERYNHRDQVLRDYDDVILWLNRILKGAPLMGDNGKMIPIAETQVGEAFTGGNYGMGEAVTGGSYEESYRLASWHYG
jgi:phage gp36-like protein